MEKNKGGRPKGSKTKPPLVLSTEFRQEIAMGLAAAAEHRALVVKNKNPEEAKYFLGLLKDFDEIIRPTVPIDIKVHGVYRYTPIQLYEMLLSYMYTCLIQGRNMTISHMTWYCGIPKDNLYEIISGKLKETPYAFIRDFVEFMTGHMEYRAQEKQNPAFHIFWLKQRGWKDKQEIELSATQGALTEEERRKAQLRIAGFSEEAPPKK